MAAKRKTKKEPETTGDLFSIMERNPRTNRFTLVADKLPLDKAVEQARALNAESVGHNPFVVERERS